MLKFEEVASLGQCIRAMDFEPRYEVRAECHIDGEIVGKGYDLTYEDGTRVPYAAYMVLVLQRVWDGEVKELPETPEYMFVPFESDMDWPERVMYISAPGVGVAFESAAEYYTAVTIK